MKRLVLAAALAFALAPTAHAQSFTDGQKDEIEHIIHEYLLENPEVLEEAIIELQSRRDQQAAERARAAIASRADDLLHDARDFSVGPEDAPVQIVEFFDYNCPYCRASAPWVKETLASYPDQVRFVFKDAPIFRESKESSDLGARAAVAAHRQGRYLDLYFAMMDSDGTIPLSQVRHIAESVGVDWRQAQDVIDDPATEQQLNEGLDLLDAIGASGTPTFVINGDIVNGADFDQLDALITAALDQGG